MNPKSDEELVRAVQNGNIFAFEAIVKRYQRGLLSFVWRFLHDETAAQDVVQDALFNVYQVIDRIDPKRKFSTYLFEVAKNAALSQLRARKKILSLDAVAELESEKPFFEEFLRSDRSETVRHAVDALQPKFREVITLYYFNDLSYEEISKKLHLPLNTIRTHLKRAKDALKKVLSYEI